MKANCQKSCKSCGKTYADINAPEPKPGCENKNPLCQFWTDLGECDKNPAFMKVDCALSCDACDGGAAPVPAPQPAPGAVAPMPAEPKPAPKPAAGGYRWVR